MHRISGRLGAAVLLAMLAFGASCPPKVKVDWLAKLGEQKVVAESEAHTFKSVKQKGSTEYQQIGDQYSDARGKINGWLLTLGSAIQGTAQVDEKTYEKLLDEAVKASRAWIEASRKARGSEKGIPAADIGDIVVKAGKAIWDEYKAWTKEERDRFLKDLEKYNWEEFDKV
jgi:hypothetical protein